MQPAFPSVPKMDFSFYRFIVSMDLKLHRISESMSVLSDRLIAVLDFFKTGEANLKQELASVKEKLL